MIQFECSDPTCELPKQPYPPGTVFTETSKVKLGQKFKIPDRHGHYGLCCKRPEPAVYVIVNMQSEDGNYLAVKCVDCNEGGPVSNTVFFFVELVP